MKDFRPLAVLSVLSLLAFAGPGRAENLYFEAEDMSLVEKMYPENLGMWPVIGNNLYIPPNWGRMPLRYTLKAAPNTVYDVIFFTGDNDPGVGNLDISWDDGKTWDISYRNMAGERKVKEKVATDSSGVISFIIAHTVGVNSSLNYIKLVNLSTTQTTISESLVSWISESPQPRAEEVLKRLADHPDSFRVLWRPKGTYEWSGQTADWNLDANKSILSAGVKGDKLFSASVTGADYEGAVRLTVTAAAIEEKKSPYELTVTASFDPGNWQRQFYPRMPYLILEPDRRTALNSLFGVLESKDGFLFWGGMDIGKFSVLTPNMVPNTIPAFSYTPPSLQNGKTLTFDITLKWFPKPEFKYRDVLRWYLCSMENSDPLTQDLVGKWDGKPYARPMPEGNLGSGGSPGEMYGQASEKEMRSSKTGSIWFMYFRPSDAPCTTEETWVNMWGKPSTREDMFEQILWLKERGFHPLLYQNQFLGCEEDLIKNPSLRKWIAYGIDGKPLPLYAFHGSEGPVDPRMYYWADFGNKEYCNWYVKKVKECVDFYKPDGLAWDCGFPQATYYDSEPYTSIGYGILRVQVELWNWIHEKYPDMRVVTNEAIGSLSQLVSDAVILENSYGGGKGKLDYEATKAMGTTIIAGEYIRGAETPFTGIPTATYRYLVMRYRAEGLNTRSQDAAVTAGLPWEPAAGPVIKCSDLQADGNWHTIVVDLNQKRPDLKEVKSLAIGVSSAETEEASLQVEFLRFSKDAAGGKAPDIRDKTNPLPYCSFFPVELNAGHFDFWVPGPAGIWPPEAATLDYSAGIKDGTTLFTVQGTGRKMGWNTLPPKFTANLMRVMSYGGCLAFGAASEYWPELNEFSAEAMGMALAAGSHDVEVKNVAAKDESAVTASAWTGAGRLLLIAYNDSGKEELSTVTVTPQVLEKAGVRHVKSSTVRILGRNGCLLNGRDADVQLTEKEGLQVQVRLEPGQALLLRVNSSGDVAKTPAK